MDYQRDSGWIEPLEATALLTNEETETNTAKYAEVIEWGRETVLSARTPTCQLTLRL
jgi:hypothetical protein